MSVFPANLARVPSALSFNLLRSQVAGPAQESLDAQAQISSGKRILRPSDDPIAASLVSVLGDRVQAADQRIRNMDHASSALATLDQALGEAGDAAREARTLAQGEVGVGATAESRESAAVVVDSILDQMRSVANRRYADLFLFAGERTGEAPIEQFFGGVRYTGSGEGLRTDLGDRVDAPITIGAEQAFGSLSTRVHGDVDLNPALTTNTAVADLAGDRGEGVTMGSIDVTIDDGVTPQTVTVDLTGAASVGDAMDAIESAVRGADPGALAGAFGSGMGVGAGGNALSVGASAGYTITFDDVGAGTTAADLGLAGFSFDNGNQVNPAADLQPRITDQTTLGALNPPTALTMPGTIVFENGGRTGTLTLNPADTIGDLRREVEALGLGIRVEINEAGDGLDAINEVSGFSMSISDDGGGSLLASSLGIRTLRTTTELSTFNDGRGVEIADGEINPITGSPDPSRNVDFRVNLRDGSSFDVDLTPADVQTVQDVLDAINAAAAGAGLAVPADFEATLQDGPNGITLVDNTGPPSQPTSVESLNGFAAEDLGLLDATFTAGAPAILAGSDRATVRVDSVFSDLIGLRDALEGNDQRGISLAMERLDGDGVRLSTARGVVGARTQRVEEARTRTEDARLLDETVRGGLEELDYAEAITRLNFLQLAQQATFAAASRSQSLNLLNFL